MMTRKQRERKQGAIVESLRLGVSIVAVLQLENGDGDRAGDVLSVVE